MARSLCLLSALAAIELCSARIGIDIAESVDVATAQCFTSQANVTFGIVRAWHSYGAFDTNAPQTVANLWSANYAHVDVYMFPCMGMNASAQVNSLMSQLQSNNVQYGMLWFDIEPNPSDNCAWSADTATNCEYMQSLVDAAAHTGKNWGVYTYHYGWYHLMGTGCTAGGNLPLWWASYDGEPNFNNWQSLGPWPRPAIKQYSSSITVCGEERDMDYYPDN